MPGCDRQETAKQRQPQKLPPRPRATEKSWPRISRITRNRLPVPAAIPKIRGIREIRGKCFSFNHPGSEQEPRSELNSTWLENIAEPALNTKVAGIVQIRIRRAEATAIEQIEELGANLERRCFGDARLLEDAEVLGVEGKCAQIAISRRSVAKEPERVCIVRAVFRASYWSRSAGV